MNSTFKKSILLSFLMLFSFINFSFSADVKKEKEFFISKEYQDKTILIKKIKSKIASLKSQKERLTGLKRWSEAKENKYKQQIDKLEKSLQKLGYKQAKVITTEEKIKKLQKQLKFLNNNKTNLQSRKKWSEKDEEEYQKKATVFIDSIIKLRMVKG